MERRRFTREFKLEGSRQTRPRAYALWLGALVAWSKPLEELPNVRQFFPVTVWFSCQCIRGRINRSAVRDGRRNPPPLSHRETNHFQP